MQKISAQLIEGKNILLRLDTDVPIENGEVSDDFRLKSSLKTLNLCLDSANKTIVLGHIGRPEGKKSPELSIEPVFDWFNSLPNISTHIKTGKLQFLENLRFEKGEEEESEEYAKKFLEFGDFFVMEAFATTRGASVNILPKLLPKAAGLCFIDEVEKILEFRNIPGSRMATVIGGAKIDTKLEFLSKMSEISSFVLVGGKLAIEAAEKNLNLPPNVLIAKLNEKNTDIDTETLEKWTGVLKAADKIIWNGPVGRFEDIQNDKTQDIAKVILENPNSQVLIGGGDTIAALKKYGLFNNLLDRPNTHISVGGGAMLELLEAGTLKSIEALN